MVEDDASALFNAPELEPTHADKTKTITLPHTQRQKPLPNNLAV
jgi:hypothetical protein